MNSNVILPKNVAISIQNFRGVGMSNRSLISSFMEGNAGRDIHDFVNYMENGFDIFVRALINGYEVEKTPEEMLYEYYVDLMETESRLENNNQSGSQFRQGWMSVGKTLEILGIKVHGIND